ncbi:MAG: hypothetical protein SFU21_04595 [Flavihumibacter sp.]|nr:hypothetical protein [Flavihumibacter sp.]
MKLLSFLNNGSQTWVLLIVLIFWVAYWGYKTIKSHKSGYHRLNNSTGKYEDENPSLTSNGNFWLLLLGVIGIVAFIIIINSEY